LYYARVTHLQAAATPSAAICQRVADGHRLVGNARPAQYSYETTFSWTDDPLSQLNKWAKAQEPPIVIGPELQDALKNIAEETGTIGELGKLPGRELYSMTHEQGSAHCLTSQFFTVEHGYARPVAGPGILGGSPGASCGAGRSFARLDGIPVLVQNKSDEHSPSLSTTEIIVTWDENLAASGCVLTFSHAPKFGRATYDEKETCEGAACDGLRAAARELVEAVQKSPKKTRERLQNRLTEAQRAEYEAAVEPLIRQRGRASEDDPAEITDFVPMLLPYVYGGKVYVASLGHFKPYGDTFADWSVKLESFAEGKPVHSAMFAVGMAKGELEDISISLSGGPER
jgi:hypothetical protein